MDPNSNQYSDSQETLPLNLLAVIGFNGTVIDGLILHPDNETLIFPIGSQIVVRNVLTRQDRFLKVKKKYKFIIGSHKRHININCLKFRTLPCKWTKNFFRF